MRERIKWLMIGFGLIIGIQAITTLMFSVMLRLTQQSPGSVESNLWGLVIFGLTLGAFLAGGFVIGRVERKPRMYDAIIAAALVLLFSAIVFQVLPENARHYFTGSKWLLDADSLPAPLWQSVLQMLPALGAAALGALLGYRIITPTESALERFVILIGLAGAVAGSVMIVIIGSLALPWYLFVAGLIVMGICIISSYWMFNRKAHKLEDIAIIAEHRYELHR